MAESNWMRHSLRLGLVGVRRRLRGMRRDRARLRLLGVSFALFAFVLTGMGALFAFGLRTSSTPILIPSSLRIGMTFAWLFVVWYVSQHISLYYRHLDNESFILTTVSTRTAVVSLLITDVLMGYIVLILPTVALMGVIGYAFVQWESIVLIPLVTVLFAASATVVGYIAGFSYLLFSARSETVDWTNFGVVMRILIRLAGLVAILAVVTTGIIPQLQLSTHGGFTWLPTSWFIDLATLGTPTTASVNRAGGILLGVLVVIAVGSAVVERLATAHWYGAAGTATAAGTTKSSTSDGSTTSPGTNALAAALSPLSVPKAVSTPTRRVAQMVLLRLRRAPRRLSFLVGPAVAFVVVRLAQATNPLHLLPLLCAAVIPWLTGATFGLNPLGDAGAVLPTTLISTSGREFVRGLMIPGMMYGLPLTVVCTFIAGVVGSYSGIELGGLIVVGAILTVVAVVLAPAIGMRFPRFDAIIVGQRSGIIPPSLVALVIYTVILSVLGGGATLAVVGVIPINSLLTSYNVSIDLIRLGGTVCVLAVGLITAVISYNSATSRFSTYTIK